MNLNYWIYGISIVSIFFIIFAVLSHYAPIWELMNCKNRNKIQAIDGKLVKWKKLGDILELLVVCIFYAFNLLAIQNIVLTDYAEISIHRIQIIFAFVLGAWIGLKIFKSISNVKNFRERWLRVACVVFVFMMCLFIASISDKTWMQNRTIILYLRKYLTNQVYVLNIGIALLIAALVYFILGAGVGTLINGLLVISLFLANYLKLRFHDTYFTWFDIYQIKELFMIGKSFVTIKSVVLIVLGMIVIFSFIVLYRKQLAQIMKPRTRMIPSMLIVGILMVIIHQLHTDKFQDIGIYERTWENEKINVRDNGLIVNLIFNFRTFQEAVMNEPENYTEQYAEELKTLFNNMDIDSNSKRPDVILILAESLFDLDGIPGLKMSKDIDATVDKYSTASLLSPRYGGYTSAVEFEALTGLSLAFMPSALTPFTTYFNNSQMKFPSIASEFNKNGYDTKVIHPNLPDFYNRTIVYQSMGFKEYQSILDFTTTSDNSTENGWLKDQVLAERIIEELQQGAAPQFLYGITMESHYVNVEKYKNPEITVTSDSLEEGELYYLQQQAESYYHTDSMIKQLIDYMGKTDRPTLLYVFGDHLPPVDALEKVGYLDDAYNKYKTSLVMYSNYKDISVKDVDYITPNQIAAQIMVDSGIEHSGYFDYIYDMRKTLPVVHREFTKMDDSALDIYKFIQYDILFGKKYLAE